MGFKLPSIPAKQLFSSASTFVQASIDKVKNIGKNDDDNDKNDKDKDKGIFDFNIDVDEMKDDIVNSLTSSVQPILDAAQETIKSGINEFKEKFDEVQDRIMFEINRIREEIKSIIDDIQREIKSNIQNTIDETKGFIQRIIDEAGVLIDKIYDFLQDLKNKVEDFFQDNLWDKFTWKNIISSFLPWIIGFLVLVAVAVRISFFLSPVGIMSRLT